MPPRYPQSNYARGEHVPAAANNNFMFSPTNAFPRGGTGGIDDSFASSLKQGVPSQAYPVGYGGLTNPNFSGMALTTHSF